MLFSVDRQVHGEIRWRKALFIEKEASFVVRLVYTWLECGIVFLEHL